MSRKVVGVAKVTSVARVGIREAGQKMNQEKKKGEKRRKYSEKWNYDNKTLFSAISSSSATFQVSAMSILRRNKKRGLGTHIDF